MDRGFVCVCCCVWCICVCACACGCAFSKHQNKDPSYSDYVTSDLFKYRMFCVRERRSTRPACAHKLHSDSTHRLEEQGLPLIIANMTLDIVCNMLTIISVHL